MKVVGISMEPVVRFTISPTIRKTQLEYAKLTLRNSVGIGQGESLLSDVGNHDDRRAPSEKLTDNGTSVCETFELVHSDGSVRVTVADLDILLSDTIKDIGSLGGNLE
jgi:hypothetical protein